VERSSGKNILKVDIQSTIEYTYVYKANYTGDLVNDYQWNYEWISPSYVQESRTQASDFGWDWSPAIAPQGIYGDVKLVKEKRVELLNPIVK